jgi:hypothetical protein
MKDELSDYRIPEYAKDHLLNLSFAASMLITKETIGTDRFNHLHRIQHIDSLLANKQYFYQKFSDCDTRDFFVLRIRGILQSPTSPGASSYYSPKLPAVPREIIDQCENFMESK